MDSDPRYRIAFTQDPWLQKIKRGDVPAWKRLGENFANCELELIEIANAIYTGHAFTTWHRNHWRDAKNYELGQHIALDFDTEDQRSTLTTLAKDPFIAKYASLIYTTFSHTPDAPRARILFLLDTPIYQTKNYLDAVAALHWVFGLADHACKDACRSFFGSPNCDCEYLDNVLPLAKVRHMIAQYQASGALAKKTNTGNFHAPADQAEVEAALQKIPAWGIEYEEWLSVLMALHAAFGDAGLQLAESWAQEGYRGEVQQKWKSFHNSGNNAGQVTIATVFGLAKRHGWQKGMLA